MWNALRQLANKFGFDVVRIQHSHSDIEFHLQNVFEKYTVDSVFDVGANRGQYGQKLRSLGYRGSIYSFEPVKDVYKELLKAADGDVKWHCFDYALGDEPHSKEINVYSSHVFSSFLDANDYAKDKWSSLKTSKTELVTIKRLDDVISTMPDVENIKNIYLKMDTQGFDKNVFEGATKTLPRVVALQTELALISIYDRMPDPYQLLFSFQREGFSISGMYPINREASLAVIEFDCVLVRGKK